MIRYFYAYIVLAEGEVVQHGNGIATFNQPINSTDDLLALTADIQKDLKYSGPGPFKVLVVNLSRL